MKLLRDVLFVLGLLLIVMNTISLTVGFQHLVKGLSMVHQSSEKFGYLLGMVLWFMIGSVLVFFARQLNRKIKRKKLEQQVIRFLNEPI